MFAVKEVSREEWLFRGLAIAMCLAMVGMAVMPMNVGLVHYYCAKQASKYDGWSLWDAAAIIWGIDSILWAYIAGAGIVNPALGLAIAIGCFI